MFSCRLMRLYSEEVGDIVFVSVATSVHDFYYLVQTGPLLLTPSQLPLSKGFKRFGDTDVAQRGFRVHM
jgi:hypothetical protein